LGLTKTETFLILDTQHAEYNRIIEDYCSKDIYLLIRTNTELSRRLWNMIQRKKQDLTPPTSQNKQDAK
jgi:hypothetical protein